MSTRCYVAAGGLLFSLVILIQIQAATLKELFPQAADGSYVAQPGVFVRPVLTSSNKTCGYTFVSTSATDDELLQIFYRIVPMQERGLHISDMIICAGICVRRVDFENVGFQASTGVDRRLTPAAIIQFKTPECAPRPPR